MSEMEKGQTVLDFNDIAEAFSRKIYEGTAPEPSAGIGEILVFLQDLCRELYPTAPEVPLPVCVQLLNLLLQASQGTLGTGSVLCNDNGEVLEEAFRPQGVTLQ